MTGRTNHPQYLRPCSVVAIAAALSLSIGCSDDTMTPADAGVLDGGGGRDSDVPPVDSGLDASRTDAGTDAGPPVETTIDFTTSDNSFGPPLPDCASPLMEAIYDQAGEEVSRGSVPLRWFATHRNDADRNVLIEGPEIFNRMADEIANAKHEVVFQTFVWERGSDPVVTLMRSLRDLETNRLADPTRTEPVIVRFLLDVFEISPSPIEVVMSNLASDLESLDLDPSAVVWEIAGYQHLGAGNLHVKSMVVDGLVGIVTGANAQSENDYDEPQHDSGYVLRGEVAIALLADFEDAWTQSDRWTCGSTMGDPDTCTETPSPVPHTVLVDPNLDDACMPMIIAMRIADGNFTSNRIDNTQDQAFLAAWNNASSHIHVMTPNLNDDAAKGALLGAIDRGVQVDIVLSLGFNQLAMMAPGLGGPNNQNADELYATVMASYPDACERLRIRWYSYDGVEPIDGNVPRSSHTKYSTIDDQIAIVGSANQDTLSWNASREVNVVVDSADVTTAWESQLFLPDHGRGIVTSHCE